MDELAMARFVNRVLVDAEQAFGRDADRRLVTRYAGEAVLNLWLADPTVTTRDTKRALARLRHQIERRSESVAERAAA